MQQSHILYEALAQYFRHHGDTFVAPDLPLELDAATTVVPVLVVALNTTDQPRTSWVIDAEGTPEIIIATAGSPAAEAKPRLEALGVRELFVFDGATATIQGFWLGPRGFAPITPLDNGRVPSDELRLELGFHHHDGAPSILRFYKRSGDILETPAETEAIRRARIARLIETHEAEIDEFDKKGD